MALPEGWLHEIWNVPPVGTVGACEVCHGVANLGWDACYPCENRWTAQSGWDTVKLVLPCSVAVGSGDWYRALFQYKQGQFDLYAPVLGGVLGMWLDAFGPRVSLTLGAKPDIVTVVPSKRSQHPTPLWQVAYALPGIRPQLRPTLRYVGQRPTSRRIAITDRFEVIEDVEGKNVLLIEDTWVTGQTSISAALALAEAGCLSIAILPIARMIYPDQASPDYTTAAEPPYTPRWPK